MTSYLQDDVIAAASGGRQDSAIGLGDLYSS